MGEESIEIFGTQFEELIEILRFQFSESYYKILELLFTDLIGDGHVDSVALNSADTTIRCTEKLPNSDGTNLSANNQLGVNFLKGVIRTYYKHDPVVHRKGTNLDYFNAQ